MDKNTLRERLAKLHAELSDAHRSDPEAHRPLGEILPDIKRLTEQPETLGLGKADSSLPQRLERVAVQFDEHGYRGVIEPVQGHGSIALLMRSSDARMNEVEDVAARVREAIVWSP